MLGFTLNVNPAKEEYADNAEHRATAVKQTKTARECVKKGANDRRNSHRDEAVDHLDLAGGFGSVVARIVEAPDHTAQSR